MGLWQTFWYRPDETGNEVTNSSGGYKPAQPSQKYPFKPIRPPRVDNKNQPWYGGPRWWGLGPDVIQNTDAVINNTSGDSTDPGKNRETMSSIWAFLNSWFGGSTPKANLRDGSQVPSVSPSMGVDQSLPSSVQTLSNPSTWQS